MKNQLIIVLVILFIAITFEFLFEEMLFNKSIIFIKFIQSKLQFSFNFFRTITYLGKESSLMILFSFAFLIFPLNYTYNFSLIFIYSLYITSVGKLINGDGRPFFVDNTLFQACSGGYGNPSGHCLRSSACYLAFSKLIIDFYKLDKIKTIITYSCSVIIILLINFSRIILGLHAIDQVIFGDLLGFILFYLVFQVLELNQRDTKEFLQSFTDVSHCISEGVFWFICFFAIIFFGHIFPLVDIRDLNRYEQIIFNLCPNVPKYNMLFHEGIFEALIIFADIGMYIGLFMLSYFCSANYPEKYEEINLFNQNNKLVYSKFILLVINLLPFYLYLFIPFDSQLGLNYALQLAVPYLVFSFLTFGLNLYYYIKFGYANQDIYNEDNKQIQQDQNNYYRSLNE